MKFPRFKVSTDQLKSVQGRGDPSRLPFGHRLRVIDRKTSFYESNRNTARFAGIQGQLAGLGEDAPYRFLAGGTRTEATLNSANGVLKGSVYSDISIAKVVWQRRAADQSVAPVASDAGVI